MTDSQAITFHDDWQLFRESLLFTEAATGFIARLIEKDYYCSVFLNWLTDSRFEELVFKGGTCLSKVHGDFYRLSEDLDFSIPITVTATRRDRSRKAKSAKMILKQICSELRCFRVAEPMTGFNDSRQYAGTLHYESCITGQPESIKIEIGLREPLLNDALLLPGRTLLINPLRKTRAVSSFPTKALSCKEAYSEKIRAALTRREPAIRDYFDIDYACRKGWMSLEDEALLDLVRRKLAVVEDEPIIVTTERLEQIRRQVTPQLVPVLREEDLSDFEIETCIRQLVDYAKRL